jgi:hypothetical protein
VGVLVAGDGVVWTWLRGVWGFGALKVRLHVGGAVLCGVAMLGLAVGVLVGGGVALAGGCPNEVLRVEDHATALPDCRSYELVSPADKSGGAGDVLNFGFPDQLPAPMQAAPVSGPEEGAVIFTGEAFFQPLNGEGDEYVARRTVSGWGTTNLTPAGASGQFEVVSVSSSLEGRYVVAATLAAGQPYRDLYVEGADASRRALIAAAPPHRTGRAFGYFSSANKVVVELIPFAPGGIGLSKIVFEVNDSLLPGAGMLENELSGDVQREVEKGEDSNYVYEWDEHGLSLVDVLPDGTVGQHAVLGHNYGASLESQLKAPDLDHAVSANGSRVFWSTQETLQEAGDLYVHEAGKLDSKLIATGGSFISATPDGSRVFYARGEGFDKTLGIPGAEVRGGDLYEYNVEDEVTRNVSEGEVYGFIGASENGEYVYFVSPEVLAGNETAEHKKAVEGEDNVYVSEPVAGHPGEHVTRFVVALAGTDNEPGAKAMVSGEPTRLADWVPTVALRTAQVSPNGEYLAFGSTLELTPVANPNAVPEIFMFDAADETLSCASCSPSGVSNGGAKLFPSVDGYGTKVQRYMLSDGSLFFTTAAALVPGDINEQDDVYEFEGGAPHLISGGTSPSASVFLDASEDGQDAYFTTSEALVGQDEDEIVDVYDARVDGGFPAPNGAPVGCSTGEGCAGGVAAPPVLAAPVTSTAGASGNVASVRTVLTAAQLRARQLARALKACRVGRRPGAKRRACEALARRRYGPKPKAKKSTRAKKTARRSARRRGAR